MRTLGIDLAAQPERTAVCAIEWSANGGQVMPPESRELSNETLAELISDPRFERIAIDAPFGWPSRFVATVVEYQVSGAWARSKQRDLQFRSTDLRMKAVTGRDPLSVTASWFAFVGWRCAEILSTFPEWSLESRRGEGRFVEIYPSASLHRWGLSPTRWVDDPGPYKKTKDTPECRSRRERLVALIQSEFIDLDLNGQEQRFVDSHDELDSLIAALTAKAIDAGLAEPIPAEFDAVILEEGWIRLPAEGSVLSEVCR